MATKKVNIDIIAKDKSKRALNNVKGSLDRVKSAVFNVRNALAGLGAGLVIRNLINTGKELENLQTRFKFLLKDANEGAKAFENLTKFASQVPFSLEEIQAGSGILATVTDNADDLQKMLEITGNVAATTGLDFRTAAEQIQRSFSAGIGAADLFREKGVRNMLGFKAGATVSIEETVEAFERVFGDGGQFGSATDELAQTLEGTLSMINDKVFTFKKTLLDAGFFAELKRQFGDLDNFLKQNQKTLDEVATDIGKGLAKAVVGLAEGIKFLADNFTLLKAAVGGFIAFKLASVIIGITNAIRLMRIQTSGLVALSGAKGLALVAASFAAMKIAANDFKEEVRDVREELRQLSLSELTKRATELNLEILKLTQQNKNLTESYEEQHDALGETNGFFPELQLNMGKQIQLENEVGQEYENNTIKIKELNEELRILNQLINQGGGGTQKLIEPLGALDNDLKGFINTNNETTDGLKDQKEKVKVLREVVGGLDGDFRNLHPTLLETINFNKNLAESFNKVEEEAKKTKPITFMTRPDQQTGMSQRDKQALADKKAHEEEVNRILLENKIEGMKIAQDMADEKLRLNNIEIEAEKRKQEELIALKKQGNKEMLDNTRSGLQAISGLNRTAFEAFKRFQIAEATINAIRSASKAFGQYPFPINIGVAATALAKGMALVAQIKSTSFREKGGPVSQGKPFIVGEKGPELFVPNQSGNIVANNKMGGSPVAVTFNINTVDARGFNELLTNSRGTIVSLINSAVNETGRQAVV